MDKQIYLFLKKLQRRLGLQRALNIFPLFLAMGCMIAFFHVGIAYFYPFYYATMIGFFWITFSFFLGTIYFFWHFPKEVETAHKGDAVIGQERLLTALELRGNESAISCLQKEDTIYHISNCNFKTSFPYHFPIQRIIGFLFMLFLFLLFLFLPSNAKTTALGLHEVKQQAKKEIRALEEVQKKLRTTEQSSKSSNLKEKSLEEKKQQLSSLLEEAKEEYDLAKSQKDLAKTKERLEAKINAIAKKTGEEEEWKKALSLISSLPLSTENNSNNSQKTSQSNSELSENKLEDNNLDLKSKSIEKQIDSTEDNEGTENASDNNTNSSSNNSYLSDSSKEQNSSYHNSNGNENRTTNSNPTAEKNSENISSSSKRETSSSKEELESSENNQKNNGSGNSKQGNSENNHSTGSGNSLENGSGNGSGYNYGSKKGIEKKRDISQEPEQITVIEHTIGEDENLTGNASKDGNDYTETGNSPLNSGVKRDFYDVIGNYTKKAYSAVENNKVPSAMTDVVKNYFSNLNS